MSYKPCHERVFPLELAPWLVYFYGEYLRWLKHLLERLGREPTLAVWQHAHRGDDDELLAQILSAEWSEVTGDDAVDMDDEINGLLSRLFPSPVEGVSSEEARQIIERTMSFRQIKQRLPSLNVTRQTSTYEALHLFFNGLALLAESLIERHGKQGELIAYDAVLDKFTEEDDEKDERSVVEFMSSRLSRFSSEPDEADMYTAGLEVQLIRGSETEVVTVVKECEWARYYQERHPDVGFLLACSLDNAAYKSANKRIRLQRTSSLMEGGKLCDFRVYAIEETPDLDEATTAAAGESDPG